MTGILLAKKESLPSLLLSVVPLSFVLVVDASRMLSIMFELSCLDVMLALRIVP